MPEVREPTEPSLADGNLGVPSWPLVGRERELDDLVVRLTDGPGGYLVGDAGVGKTRLVTEAMRQAAERGVVPRRVAVTASAASVPLTPFLALLPPGLDTEQGDRLALFRAVTDELQSAPIVVVVDDAHLLAEPAAALLLHLALSEVPVVAVVRDGADVPDAVTALWKDGLVPRMELGTLAAAAVGELLAAVLDGPVEQTTVTRLHHATGGNPLFLRELVLAGLRAGGLALADGLWRIVGPLPIGRPLRELVRRRIDHLDPAVRTTLELLAVAETWPVEALDPGHRHALEVLEDGALVRVDFEGDRLVARPAHPVLGETIRSGLGTIAVHGALRELISMHQSAGLRRRDDRLRLAVWQLEIGDAVEPAALVEASRRALQLMDADLAAGLAAAARAAGGGTDATVALAAAEIERNRFDAAEAELASCEEAALAGSDAAGYALRRGYALGLGLGRVDDALAFLDRAAGHVAPAERLELDALRAALLAAASRMDEAGPLAEAVTADPGAGPAAVITATAPAGMDLIRTGLFEQAIARCRPGMALVAEHGAELVRERIWALGTHIVALSWAGRYAEVEAVVRPVYDAAVAARDEFTRGSAAGVLGTTVLESGRPAEAKRWLQEALSPLTRSDPYGLLGAMLVRLALAEALVGDAPAGRAALDRAGTAVRGQLRWHVLPQCQAEAWLLAAEGDVAGARAVALQHADAVSGSETNRAVLLHDAVRLGADDPAVLRTLIELTDRFEGARFAAVNAHARAVASADPEQVWASVDDLADHACLLAAADAAGAAAALFEAAEDRRHAAAAKRRALDLIEEAGAVPTPAVRELTPTPLTKRERQVAALAGAGRSDREIAEALQVSVRTVHSHLYRAYAKLGVTGREALRGLTV